MLFFSRYTSDNFRNIINLGQGECRIDFIQRLISYVFNVKNYVTYWKVNKNMQK